jgi:hypothetical protein
MILAQAPDTSMAWVSRHVLWAPTDTTPPSTLFLIAGHALRTCKARVQSADALGKTDWVNKLSIKRLTCAPYLNIILGDLCAIARSRYRYQNLSIDLGGTSTTLQVLNF